MPPVADHEEVNRSTEDQTVEAELGAELIRLLEESYGTGAGAIRVISSEDTLVVIFDELELQRSEEFLIEQGRSEVVTSTRNMYQQAIEATFRAAVERIIGRRVVSFASTTQLDPNYAVEVFRLGPRRDPAELANLEGR
jgi:uncharacterized protein YbcI